MIQKNLQLAIAKRLANLQRHNADPALQSLSLAICSQDIRQWWNDWVWTYDPRIEVPFVPMVLFPRQEEFLTWLEEREETQTDGVGDKSRDMGLTWLCSGFLIHRWLFRQGWKGSIGSRKETLIDRLGDPDSIFEKMRMLLRYLPAWMMPAGWDPNQHDNFCKLINPANGATITGEAGEHIGRGGRSSIYIVDEAGYVEHAERMDAALSANTNVRIYVSTPQGMGNLFARRRHSGSIAVFSMHWKSDPRKNAWELVRKADGEVVGSGEGGTAPPEEIPDGCVVRYPWYEAEKARLEDPVIVAQELDIDYTASLEGVTIPAKWVQAAVDLSRRMKLPQAAPRVAGLDVADGGTARNVVTIRSGPVVESIHERREGGTTDTANWALDTAKAAKAELLNYDSVGVGAGIAGTFETRSRTENLGLATCGVNVGRQPTETLWPDGATSQEKFLNLKAEIWWTVRRRFEKTYEVVELGADYPLDELISIPDHPDLTSQLSNVLHFRTETGKIQIETKKQLVKRGVVSPDFAESLMLAFTPAEVPARLAPTTILTARTR